MNAVTKTDSLPWYREPWPWVLIALPAAAVVGCSITLYLALASADGMVARDYYKRGLAINSELARSRRAVELGLRADVALAGYGSGERVRVQLSAERALPAETALRLTLVHPARDGADRTLLLGRVSAGDGQAEYSGQFDTAAAPGVAWQVVLESPSWRLDGQIGTHDARHFRLEAAPR